MSDKKSLSYHFHQGGRGIAEQFFDIMFALKYGPLILTHVLYKANLNLTVLKELLEYLSGEGFVEYLPDGRVRLTVKGYSILKVVTPFFTFIAKSRELRKRSREGAIFG